MNEPANLPQDVRTCPSQRKAPPAGACCGACRFFCNDPLLVEQQTPGLAVLSSGFAAVRAGDGICSAHSRLVPVYALCARFRGHMR